MVRHRDRSSNRTPTLQLHSARSLDDIIYQKELDAPAGRDADLRVVYALTRQQPEDWTVHRGRIDKALLAETCFPLVQGPTTYVWGPTSFVENVSRASHGTWGLTL